MQDWNVIVTLFHELGAYRRARAILRRLGEIDSTEFHNVLIMRVENVDEFLEAFLDKVTAEPGIMNDISRVTPLKDTFDFQSAQDFETKSRAIALSLLPRLHNCAFHVRLHRRGMGKALNSHQEERFLDEALLAALEEARAPGRISFEDPDIIIDVETAGDRAGLSLWTRDDLERYPFLRID